MLGLSDFIISSRQRAAGLVSQHKATVLGRLVCRDKRANDTAIAQKHDYTRRYDMASQIRRKCGRSRQNEQVVKPRCLPHACGDDLEVPAAGCQWQSAGKVESVKITPVAAP